MSNSRDVLLKSLEEITGSIYMEDIEQMISKTREKKSKKDKEADEILDIISERLKSHPLIKKVIDQGNISRHIRRSDNYKKLKKLLESKQDQDLSPVEMIEAKQLMQRILDDVKQFIVNQAIKAEQGLRRMHSPGSVAKSEAMNLYFSGEKYSENILTDLASQLYSSIALGDSVGIYTEDEELLENLKQLIAQKFDRKARYKISADRLEISDYESKYPFSTFLGFLFWLMDYYDRAEGDEKNLLTSIIEGFKRSSVTIYFMPPEKEKWRIINVPRLEIFIDMWMLNRDNRTTLREFKDELINAIKRARRKAQKDKTKIDKVADIIMNNYEIFCQRLITYGDLDLYALRRIIDIVIDLDSNYDIGLNLSKLGELFEFYKYK